MTLVVFCSWFSDWHVRPLTLCISGLDMDRSMRLFRLLHAICRRAIMVAELSFSFPLFLSPTLLVNVPTMWARAGRRMANFELSRRVHSRGSGHTAQYRLQQANFLRERRRPGSLGAGSSGHCAGAHERKTSASDRIGGSLDRRGISGKVSSVPPATFVRNESVRCFLVPAKIWRP